MSYTIGETVNKRKLLKHLLNNQQNIRFTDMQSIVVSFGFTLDRINGSHHIYKRDSIPEMINLQNVDGQAKPYQVRQFLKLIDAYDLKQEDV